MPSNGSLGPQPGELPLRVCLNCGVGAATRGPTPTSDTTGCPKCGVWGFENYLLRPGLSCGAEGTAKGGTPTCDTTGCRKCGVGVWGITCWEPGLETAAAGQRHWAICPVAYAGLWCHRLPVAPLGVPPAIRALSEPRWTATVGGHTPRGYRRVVVPLPDFRNGAICPVAKSTKLCSGMLLAHHVQTHCHFHRSVTT